MYKFTELNNDEKKAFCETLGLGYIVELMYCDHTYSEMLYMCIDDGPRKDEECPFCGWGDIEFEYGGNIRLIQFGGKMKAQKKLNCDDFYCLACDNCGAHFCACSNPPVCTFINKSICEDCEKEYELCSKIWTNKK
jgi:hypothetical protein